MKAASPKSNLGPPNRDDIDFLQRLLLELRAGDSGAIIWSEDEGFVLKLPDLEDDEKLPIPLYLLGLCFMRLNNDPDFPGELLEWSNRKPN